MNVSLAIVLPRPMGNSKEEFLKRSLARIDRMETISGLLFGTSIPMVPRPEIGLMMLIPRPERLNAISFSRFLILERRTPGNRYNFI